MPGLGAELDECPDGADDMVRLRKWTAIFKDVSAYVALMTSNFVSHMGEVVLAHGNMMAMIA